MSGGSNLPPPTLKRVDGAVLICCPHPGCSRTFAKQANYVSHSRTHTGETPYSCDICGLQFRWQSSQKAHMKSHERRRQRQASDSAHHASNNMGIGSGGGPSGSQGGQRGSNLPPAPHTTLPAIRSQPPHSAPRVEALEPPVAPPSYPRPDAKITPLHPGRLGGNSHAGGLPNLSHGQSSSRPAAPGLGGHASAHGQEGGGMAGASSSGGGTPRSPPARRPTAPPSHPSYYQNAGSMPGLEGGHGRSAGSSSGSRGVPGGRAAGFGSNATAGGGTGSGHASGSSAGASGAGPGSSSGTAHRQQSSERRSKYGQRPTRSHHQ